MACRCGWACNCTSLFGTRRPRESKSSSRSFAEDFYRFAVASFHVNIQFTDSLAQIIKIQCGEGVGVDAVLCETLVNMLGHDSEEASSGANQRERDAHVDLLAAGLVDNNAQVFWFGGSLLRRGWWFLGARCCVRSAAAQLIEQSFGFVGGDFPGG